MTETDIYQNGGPHIDVRILTADNSRLEDIIRIHMEAFRGFFLTFLGRRFLKVYYDNIISNPDGVCLVSIEGGRVTGFITGFINPSGFYMRLLRKQWHRFAFAALPSILAHPAAAGRLLGAFRKPGLASKAEYSAELSSIAVVPETQNRGVGKLLVRAFFEECRARGCNMVYLTTDADYNEKVNRFYEALGFRTFGTCITPEGRRMNEYKIFLTD